MFVVLLGLVFSKRTFLKSFPGVNDGATVGSEGVNRAGDNLLSSGGGGWKSRHGGAGVEVSEFCLCMRTLSSSRYVRSKVWTTFSIASRSH
jgi:hypothetical protein